MSTDTIKVGDLVVVEYEIVCCHDCDGKPFRYPSSGTVGTIVDIIEDRYYVLDSCEINVWGIDLRKISKLEIILKDIDGGYDN